MTQYTVKKQTILAGRKAIGHFLCGFAHINILVKGCPAGTVKKQTGTAVSPWATFCAVSHISIFSFRDVLPVLIPLKPSLRVPLL